VTPAGVPLSVRRIDQPTAFPVPARCASHGYCRHFQATLEWPPPGQMVNHLTLR
jgi:hypothetical protein